MCPLEPMHVSESTMRIPYQSSHHTSFVWMPDAHVPPRRTSDVSLAGRPTDFVARKIFENQIIRNCNRRSIRNEPQLFRATIFRWRCRWHIWWRILCRHARTSPIDGNRKSYDADSRVLCQIVCSTATCRTSLCRRWHRQFSRAFQSLPHRSTPTSIDSISSKEFPFLQKFTHRSIIL